VKGVAMWPSGYEAIVWMSEWKPRLLVVVVVAVVMFIPRKEQSKDVMSALHVICRLSPSRSDLASENGAREGGCLHLFVLNTCSNTGTRPEMLTGGISTATNLSLIVPVRFMQRY
jgi:hypothetical protein